MILNGPVAARHGLLPLDLLSDASGPALRRPRVGSMTSSHHRWPRPCPICTPMCNASAMQCACRRTRGSPFWALGCGQAGRPPHPAEIVGQNRCGTLRRRKNVLFCGDSHPTTSTCFRDRGSCTANSAADDPRSRPGPLKRGEMSRLPVRFARSGAATPHLTHNLAWRSRPPAQTRPASARPAQGQAASTGQSMCKNPQAPRGAGMDYTAAAGTFILG